MKFYIVDDDQAILYVLQNIIEQNFNDEVIGMTTSPRQAQNEIQLRDVDIVLADLLMPDLSGIDLVKAVKAAKPQVRFIMISKVQDSDLRAKAYQAGIEFFINKPVNLIEVKTVITKVEQSLQMAQQLSSISAMVNQFNGAKPTPEPVSVKEGANTILKVLGMAAELGSADILQVITLMDRLDEHYRDVDLTSQLKIDGHEKKIMVQRMRRAIKVGLTNLANQLLDNPDDDQIRHYANALFGYENVHHQMLFQQHERPSGGRVIMQNFMDGLLSESRE
ncbi:DNA-binding domain-containing protein [Limosilactobacillus kribbianus]|uniref:DNA-binding domain-containing protein n=1 Tax=Limosilactobacillus kribbianus TaxID=2982695 RepID=UPI002263AF0B|nr:DNA-binding domain-containing protein [Limosilactobacillus kribbianus]